MTLDTRTRLLQAGLQGFATTGYAGTSIRDLAGAVGIKESSVYKHFSSKQAIFDALLAWTQQRHAEAAAALGLGFTSPDADASALTQAGVHDITATARALFDFSLSDEVASSFRRLLTVEQFRNPRVGAMLNSYFVETPITFQTQVFEHLMTAGIIRRGDPSATALAFWGPVWLLICSVDADPSAIQTARKRLEAHVAHFIDNHKTEA